jgi:FG-GAP repeat
MSASQNQFSLTRVATKTGGPSKSNFLTVFTLMVLVCATLLSSHPALAQFSQQGPKLVGTDAAGIVYQGYSVALSADGNTAIVGGDYGIFFPGQLIPGAAWVWTRSGGVWAQQGNKLVGSDAVGNADQGCSVALSADGNTAIVGGSYDNDPAGAAWIWTRSSGIWTQQGAKLVGSGTLGAGARQGSSVSLSADGNTAIVGSWAGAAWVWTRSGGVWTQQGSKLV